MRKILLVLTVAGAAGLVMLAWTHAQEAQQGTEPPTSQPVATFGSLIEQAEQLERAGNYAAALSYYQQALANKRLRPRAVYGTAVCYRGLGDLDKARAALKVASEEAPAKEWGIKAVALAAELDGKSPAQIEALVAREQEAAGLLRQAGQLMRQTNARSPEPLALFDRVLAEYPGTGAAYLALVRKGELFWHLAKREEMCQCYDQLRAILRTHTRGEHV